jgi:hypothetical protein
VLPCRVSATDSSASARRSPGNHVTNPTATAGRTIRDSAGPGAPRNRASRLTASRHTHSNRRKYVRMTTGSRRRNAPKTRCSRHFSACSTAKAADPTPARASRPRERTPPAGGIIPFPARNPGGLSRSN